MCGGGGAGGGVAAMETNRKSMSLIASPLSQLMEVLSLRLCCFIRLKGMSHTVSAGQFASDPTCFLYEASTQGTL